MSFFSSWIKVIFITALAFPLYSETSFSPRQYEEKEPDCNIFKNRQNDCFPESIPICATNGQTFANACVFCNVRHDGFGFKHYGECK